MGRYEVKAGEHLRSIRYENQQMQKHPPEMDPTSSMTCLEAEKFTDSAVEELIKLATHEVADDTEENEVFPLSGNPYFTAIISKSSGEPRYDLNFPPRIQQLLPLHTVPVVLSYGGRSWDMLCVVKKYKRLDRTSWKKFATDNNLKHGDGCVFEILECSDTIIKVKVQILRGDLPLELLPQLESAKLDSAYASDKFDDEDAGNAPDNPLIID